MSDGGAFWLAVESLLSRVANLPINSCSVSVLITGGAAVHYHTDHRTSPCLDVEFSRRIIVPQNLSVFYFNNGVERELALQQAGNNFCNLVHADHFNDAPFIKKLNGSLDIHVLSPIDLIVSKTMRLNDKDVEDITYLAKLIDIAVLKTRIQEARSEIIGDLSCLDRHIDKVLSIIQSC